MDGQVWYRPSSQQILLIKLSLFILTQVLTEAVLISGGELGNKSLVTPVSTSENHSLANTSMLTDQQRIKLKEIRKLARLAGHEHPEVITEVDEKICYEKDCLDAAKEFYTAMDFSQEPCEDWTKFACEWRTLSTSTSFDQVTSLSLMVENQVKDILADNEIDNELILTAQNYLKLCIDWENMEGSNQLDHILQYLQKIVNWPLLAGENNLKSSDWIEVMAEILKILPDDVNSLLLRLDVIPIDGKMILKIDSGEAGLSLNYDEISLLLQHMTKKAPDRVHQAEFFKGLENIIKSIASTKFTTGDSGETIELKMLGEKLKSEVPDLTISLSDILHKVFRGTDLTVTSDMKINSNWTELAKYLRSIQSLDQKNLVNLLALQLLLILIGDTTRYFDKLHMTGMRNYQRHLARSPASQCYAEILEAFNYAISEEYVRRHLKEKSLTAVEEMTNFLKHGFQFTIDSISWLETKSREAFKEKITNMKVFFGYPEWIGNETAMEAYYENITRGKSVQNVKTYLDYRLAILSWMNGKYWNMKLLDEDPNAWNFNDKFGFVGDSNLQYFPSLNQLRIPAGAIQVPLFSADYPGYMNFGGLGSIIAREMARAFDSDGIFHNREGEYGLLLDEESHKNYKDWIERVQRDWNDDDLAVNEKVVNILSFHIVTHGYHEFLKKFPNEKELPGLSTFSPEKLLYIKLTNAMCSNPLLNNLLNADISSASFKMPSLYPITKMKSFAKEFGCENDILRMAFDFM